MKRPISKEKDEREYVKAHEKEEEKSEKEVNNKDLGVTIRKRMKKLKWGVRMR